MEEKSVEAIVMEIWWVELGGINKSWSRTLWSSFSTSIHILYFNIHTLQNYASIWTNVLYIWAILDNIKLKRKAMMLTSITVPVHGDRLTLWQPTLTILHFVRISPSYAEYKYHSSFVATHLSIIPIHNFNNLNNNHRTLIFYIITIL